MSTRDVYQHNGALGILTHLAESKLIFPEEYAILHGALTDPKKSLKGAEELMAKLMTKNLQSYRAEDLFNLMGLLAEVCSEAGKAMQQVKVNGDLAKLPFGSTSRLRPRWKVRYFRLVDQGLTYFAKSGDSKPKGQLVLGPNTYIRDASFAGRPHCFDIITRNGTLSIAAESNSEKELWVCGLARVIHSVRASASAAQSVAAPSFSMASGSVVGIDESQFGATLTSKPSQLSKGLSTAGGFSSSSDNSSRESVQKLGYLYKLALKSRRNWKKRYFVQYRNLLSYFESELDKRAKNDMLLDTGARILNGLPDNVDPSSLGEDLSLDCCFYITSKELKFTVVLAAETPSERYDWVESLQQGAHLGDNLLYAEPLSSVETASYRSSRNISTRLNASFPSSSTSECTTEVEIILTQNQRQGSEGSSIGRLYVTPDMPLVAIREHLYRELDAADLPLDFAFLLKLNKVVRMPRSAPQPDSALGRLLQHEYTKVSKTQEELLGADRMIDDDCRIYLLDLATSTAGVSNQPSVGPGQKSNTWDVTSTAAAAAARVRQQSHDIDISALAPTKLSGQSRSTTGNVTQNEAPGRSEPNSKADNSNDFVATSESAVGEIETLKAIHEAERAKWDKEMRKLRAELAESRNMILNMQRGNVDAQGSTKSYSPLETMMMKLQRDGYLEDSVSTKKLSRTYRHYFEENDISAYILADGGPYEQLVRRYIGDPGHVRDFLEGLEMVLKTHTISKVRLTQPWWAKKLKDVSLLKMDQTKFLNWAKSEPWTEDTEERYAFLMGKMRPGAITEAHTTLLKPRPSYDDDATSSGDESDTGNAGEDFSKSSLGEDSELHSEEKEEASAARPKPAFLQSINSLGKESSKSPPKPAFLQSIKSLKPENGAHGKSAGSQQSAPAPPRPNFLQSIQGFDKSSLSKGN